MIAFLGVDVGGTKTRALLVNEAGDVLGIGEAGPGNHEVVGYSGLKRAVHFACEAAFKNTGLSTPNIAGAGFGVAGYDWPGQKEPVYDAISVLELKCPIKVVNDTVLGIIAGSCEGWGLAVVSGTGCNCWGWDRSRNKVGQATGGGLDMGEGAGASEIVARAIQVCAHAWTRRGPSTSLSERFTQLVGAKDLGNLLEGIMIGQYSINASAAPIIFEEAAKGDEIAKNLITWAGSELGELVNAVICQLEFQRLVFDVVMMGSMFDGGTALITPMIDTVHHLAPSARFTRLNTGPVVGAVLLGMEYAGKALSNELREHLIASYNSSQAA